MIFKLITYMKKKVLREAIKKDFIEFPMKFSELK